MSNKNIVILVIVVLVVFGFYFFNIKSNEPVVVVKETPQNQNVFDPRNATYEINGASVTLVNGEAQTEAAPGSATKITTRYFGNEATGDLNFDKRDDLAFLISQDTGGSGLFYYAVVAIKTDDGYKLTNPFFIGDRIAPQSTNIISGELNVNYAERKPGEPMTAEPSQGAVKLLKVTPDGVLEGLMK